MSLSVCLISYGQTDVRSRGSGTGTDQPAQPQQGQKRYSGRILDQNGQPVVGATISVVDAAGKTVAGTYTDADGNYSVSAAPGLKLKVSSVSYTATETTLGDSETLNYTLQEESTLIEEVVVIGYGTQTKRDLSGSVSKVTGESIRNLPVQGFDQALQGRAAGVQITTQNGLLNNPPIIRVRGTNSISQNSQPLVVIDNVPIISGQQSASGAASVNPLSEINPNDIESIEILKDAASTAIYGSRGTNGVLLVTTKKGKQGKVNVNYEFFYGWAQPFRTLSVMNAEQFIAVKNTGFANLLAPPSPADRARPSLDANGNPISVDWQKELWRTGRSQTHNLNISGGTDKTSYYFSLNYTDQAGFVPKNNFRRSSVRMNINHKVTEWLQFGANVQVSGSSSQAPNTGSLGNQFATVNISRLALIMFPNVPIYDANGFPTREADGRIGRGNNLNPFGFQQSNPYTDLLYSNSTAETFSLIGDFSGTIDFGKFGGLEVLRGLKLTTRYSMNLINIDNRDYDSYLSATGTTPNGNAIGQYQTNRQWQWQNLLTYDRVFADKHNVSIVAGLEYQNTLFDFYGINLVNQTDPLFSNVNGVFVTPSALRSNFGGLNNGLVSALGRVTYNYASKYLFSASIRQDGLSTVARRFGYFPSVSLGWVISEEQFFKNFAVLDIVDMFKVRGSAGLTGNAGLSGGFVNPYPYLGLFGSALYGTSGSFFYSQAGNSELAWEVAQKYDIGFDLVMFKGRLEVNYDYYLNNTNNLRLANPQAPSKGIPGGSIEANVGRMSNWGSELTISGLPIKTSKFSWKVDFNITSNWNAVNATIINNQDINGSFTGGLQQHNVIRVGQPLGAFFMPEWVGVNPNDGRAQFRRADGAVIQYNHATGVWQDINNVNVSPLGGADRRIVGNPLPSYFGGFNNTFTFYGFDVSIFLQFSGGNYIYNGTRAVLHDGRFFNGSPDLLSAWSTVGQITDIPRLVAGDNVSNQISTRYLEKGDFIRVRNIICGYTIPQKIVSRLKLASIRVYAQVQNLGVLTGYKGIDPEITSSSPGNQGANVGRGVDVNSLPQSRNWTVGINVGF